MRILVRLLHTMAISPASNGREKMDATEMRRLVVLLLKMTISPASNGRD